MMNYIGSRQIETERLILKAQTMQEQKRLWEILMIPEVNKYFLTVPSKFREKLLDWNKQEKYYKMDMEHANDSEIFRWSIFLKETGECIGRVSCHERHDEDESITDPSIRGVGWLIDPVYQGKGYATEAAIAMIDYMFEEVDISEIRTGAAISNPASWRIMEKLGFVRQDKTRMVQYTFLDEPVEDYSYNMTKERWLNFKNQKNIRKNEKERKKLTIDEYIDISKSDISVYVIVTIILLSISLYIGIKYSFYYHLLFIGVIMIGRIAERIDTYYTLRKIKSYLIENNLLDKIGNIDYWNERYYLLTNNYMIIKQKKEIYSFKYSQIERMFKESNLELSKHSSSQEYLHIITNDNEFKVLTYTSILVGEDYKDISDYLLKKNPNIKVDETINNTKIDVFRIGKR